MTCFKLFRKLKDGSITSLFADKTRRLPQGRWLRAQLHPVKGLKPRKGFHCVLKKKAPHLSKKGRVWKKVEVEKFEKLHKSKAFGGDWIIAQKIKILKN